VNEFGPVRVSRILRRLFRRPFLLYLYPKSDPYPKSSSPILFISLIRSPHPPRFATLRRADLLPPSPTALEALSATSAPVIRHSSTSEKTWLHDLVAIHGDDTEAMARDKKRNVWQKTEGEIRRMIKKAGGRGRLMATA
jgi:hypothetical protein